MCGPKDHKDGISSRVETQTSKVTLTVSYISSTICLTLGSKDYTEMQDEAKQTVEQMDGRSLMIVHTFTFASQASHKLVIAKICCMENDSS